jgi:K+-sensing histidine kinase KdpD
VNRDESSTAARLDQALAESDRFFSYDPVRDYRLTGADLTPEAQIAVERHMGFARSLHIETTVLAAKDVAKAIADFAREHKVTQLFISHNSKAAQSLVNRARDMQVTLVAERRR